MADINNFIFSGRLTTDTELKLSENGKSYCRFCVATQRFGVENASFINCTAFGHNAEFISKYLGKGSPVVVEGNVDISSYQKDGETRYATQVMVQNIQSFKVNNNVSENNTSNNVNSKEEFVPVEDDDLPF